MHLVLFIASFIETRKQQHNFSIIFQLNIKLFLFNPVVFWSDCCGCGKEFKNEQSLVALDKHWHLGCFKCKVCNKVLNAEYISK